MPEMGVCSREEVDCLCVGCALREDEKCGRCIGDKCKGPMTQCRCKDCLCALCMPKQCRKCKGKDKCRHRVAVCKEFQTP